MSAHPGSMAPRLFIDGAWRAPEGRDTITVTCPSTEEVIGEAAIGLASEVDLSVAAARRAFDDGPWPRMSPAERASVVVKAAKRLAEQAEDLGRLVTLEMGVPVGMSTAMVGRVPGTAEFYAGLAASVAEPEYRDEAGAAVILRQPVGVVAAIVPWNGPVGMSVTKIVPALLAGCTVVFKPAPETPFDIAFLVDALVEAGLPKGVLNVVTGGAETGQAMVRHPGIDKVTFTGSTAAGREIGSVAGHGLKRLQLELGGKSAAIVLPDADLEQVTAGIGMGCFFNSGQVCAALSRVLAPRSRYDEVVAVVEAAASSWRVGDPFDPATTMGPLVSARQRDKVQRYIDDGVRAGARVVVGGGRPGHLDKGWFIEPTVLRDVDNSMQIAQEEIFGPVAVVIPFDDVDHAVRIANDSQYGLHGAVFTVDGTAAMDVAGRVRTGTFTVNGFSYNNRLPFGGVKNSGVGRDSGKEGLESYLELKTVNLDPIAAQPFRSS